MRFIINLIKIFFHKFILFDRDKFLTAKSISVTPEQFDSSNLTLGNSFKVNENTYIKDFISKIDLNKLTVVVVNKKGKTVGYISKKQINELRK